MYNDTSKQTTAQILINKNDLKRFMNTLFNEVYEGNSCLIAPLTNDKTKVQSIKSLKQYLNQNFLLYSLSIIFVGGTSQEYKTAIQISLLK
tara:strand:- start:304 stop:576 length:273 start_codon:yes stop_codon:yes gene_type:complete